MSRCWIWTCSFKEIGSFALIGSSFAEGEWELFGNLILVDCVVWGFYSMLVWVFLIWSN